MAVYDMKRTKLQFISLGNFSKNSAYEEQEVIQAKKIVKNFPVTANFLDQNIKI